MNKVNITAALRDMEKGDTLILKAIERPNIHSLAKRALRQVKVNKRDDGSFLVTCTGVLSEVVGEGYEKTISYKKVIQKLG